MSIFSFTKVTTSENFSLIIQTQLIQFVKQMESTKGNEAQNGNKKIKNNIFSNRYIQSKF